MTALTIAKTDDIERLMKLVADFHIEADITQDEDTRRAALMPLLQGSSHGVIYLIGPMRAPVGYVALSFGWSIEYGGLDGFIDEIYIRPRVRGRGIGSEVLIALPRALSGSGLKTLHLEVHRENHRARKLYSKLRFEARETYTLMSKTL